MQVRGALRLGERMRPISDELAALCDYVDMLEYRVRKLESQQNGTGGTVIDGDGR